ncbi:hypothetical protein H8B09_22260 [Paenibacillus sp. PR3]|uniref:Glycosyl transferase family 28 C-terminal domain-containing protein n=1 Tax=Paenibacillus terricola TaxID=2763503 RepID=A0ABR8MZY5_9BACL|nr:hypothetical protein [Paenibacillus terricola]MBD3921508.1 hypothetical protein [Paenibacillus terricola]
MRTICYYISDYGYGHATRGIAIIRRLLKDVNELRLIVCSAKPLAFIQQSLLDITVPIEYRKCSSDLGYILQEGSIEPDSERFGKVYLSYLENMPSQIESERRFLYQVKADLVISDISPVPIVAAKLADIASMGISNFTWHTAYKQMTDEKMLEPLYDAYANMDYFVSLAGGTAEPRWGRLGYMEAGFFCRALQEEVVARLQSQYNPQKEKLMIFFAIGMSIQINDLQQMAMWNDPTCLFVISSSLDIDGDNIIRIPEDVTESQNYMAMCDIVITKPGWGTVGEAVTLGKPLLLLDRSSMQEDRNTIEALHDDYPYRRITWHQLQTLHVTRAYVGAIQDVGAGRRSRINKDNAIEDIISFIESVLER